MGLDQDLRDLGSAIEDYISYFEYSDILNDYEKSSDFEDIEIELTYNESGAKVHPKDRKIKLGRKTVRTGSKEEFERYVQRTLHRCYSIIVEEEIESQLEQYGKDLDIESDPDIHLSSRSEETVYEPDKDALTVNLESYDDIGPEKIAQTVLHGKLRKKMEEGKPEDSAYNKPVIPKESDDFLSGDVESVGDIFTAYHRGMETVQKEENLFFEPPELVVGELDDGSGYRIDAENNYMEIDQNLVGKLDKQLLLEDAALMADRFYDESLKQNLEELAECLDSLYAEWDTNTTVDRAYFGSLKDDRIAEHRSREKDGETESIIGIDNTEKAKFDPVNGIFRSKGMNHTAVHEVAHALESQNSPVISDIRSRANNGRNDDDDSYRDNVYNALKEVISTFEAAMTGSEGYSRAHMAVNDPTRMPGFFNNYFDLGERPTDSYSIRDPYNLPLFTALSLNKALVEEHGIEEGTKATRGWILNADKNLDSMKEMVETSLEERGLSNYPQIYRETQQKFEASDDPVRTAEEEAERVLEKDFERPINQYLEGSAVIRAVEDERLLPEADTGELDRELCELMDELKLDK